MLLALAMAGPSEKEDIPLLSRSLSSEYADKTHKTLTRDLNSLEGENLVKRDGLLWTANLDLIFSLLPVSKKAAEIVSETQRKAVRSRTKQANK